MIWRSDAMDWSWSSIEWLSAVRVFMFCCLSFLYRSQDPEVTMKLLISASEWFLRWTVCVTKNLKFICNPKRFDCQLKFTYIMHTITYWKYLWVCAGLCVCWFVTRLSCFLSHECLTTESHHRKASCHAFRYGCINWPGHTQFLKKSHDSLGSTWIKQDSSTSSVVLMLHSSCVFVCHWLSHMKHFTCFSVPCFCCCFLM